MTRIAVVGPGAVAGVVLWHLAKAGLSPKVLARPATAERLAREGLHLVGAGIDATVRVDSASDPRSLGPQDVVLVGFKAQDWETGIDMILPLVGEDTLIVPLQNGIPWWFFHGFGGGHAGHAVESIDPHGRLAAAFPPERIAGCAVYVAATRETPSRLRWNGRKRLVLGSATGRPDARIRSLATLLRGAGIDVTESAEIRRDIWSKLLGNVAHNPLSVVTGATIGRMATHAPFRRIMAVMMAETVAVGQAIGVCDAIDIEARLAVPAEMAHIRTSMLQDFEAGRPLELGAIVDAVVELGALVRVPTPMTEAIGALAAERARQRGSA